MDRRVQLRKGESKEKDDRSASNFEVHAGGGSSDLGIETGSEDGSDHSEAGSSLGYGSESQSDLSEVPEEPGESLKDISFGGLLEAQASLPPVFRKRKVPPEFDIDESQKEQPEVSSTAQRPTRKDALPRQHRPSKHAPTMLSSRQQVSRKRDVFEPSPALKARDPRFDPTIQASNHDRNAVEKANKNYSFLTSYQAAEILDLKSQIKKSKDSTTVADLKRKVMSIESKIRNAQARQRERDIMQQHKQKEKAAITSGDKAKPYYLKESDVKKIAKQERVEGMSKSAQDKSALRKQKREKTKAARDMPRVRRE